MDAETSGEDRDARWPTVAMAVLLAVSALAALGGATVAGQAAPGSAPDQAAPGSAADSRQVDPAPTANLTVSPNPAHFGEAVVLDGRDSTAGDGSIAYCEFDVDGDGTYDVRRQDCVVEYSSYALGEYDIGLRVTTTTELTATASETLVVTENEAPTVAIGVEPTAPRPGEPVTLVADAADGDGTVRSHRWRIGDETRNGSRIETSLEAVGEYEVSLTVTDDDGATETARRTVVVEANRPPNATLVADPAEASLGGSVRLDASGSVDPDGLITAYRWDLDGDGTVDRTTSDPAVDVSPADPGEYAATVTVIDDRNATDTATVRFAVAPDRTATVVDGPGAGDSESGSFGALDRGLVPVVPDLLLVLALLVIGGVAGVAVRRRETLGATVDRLRELLTRGDVRRRLAKKISGAAVKKAAKTVLRRFSDLVEAGGEVVGEGFEALGRAIKRASSRVAEWLRRLGS